MVKFNEALAGIFFLEMLGEGVVSKQLRGILDTSNKRISLGIPDPMITADK